MKNQNNSCIDSILKDIINDIINENVAIFFGAGLSKNSGNLTTNRIKKCLLCSFNYNGEPIFHKNIINILDNRMKQFEDFLNRIHDDVNIESKKKTKLFSKLFKILYSTGFPNKNHYLIAQLIKKGCIKKVYTTNLDTHLEKAYEDCFSEKLKTSIIDPNVRDVPYIKLHGCISKIDSIGTLLNHIASKDNKKKLEPLIRDILTSGDHKTVLFMGYSFSDVYDIVEIIEKVSKSEYNSLKKIFIIMNDEKYSEIYTDYPSPYNCIFKKIQDYNEYAKKLDSPKREINFDHKNIRICRYDTSKFIDMVYAKSKLPYKTILEYNEETTIKEIKNWVTSIDEYYKLLIGWRFNYEAGQEFILIKNKKRKFPNPKIIKNLLNNDLTRLNALEKAKDCCEKNLMENKKKLNLSHDKKKMIEVLNKKHKALTLLSMGNFSDANTILESLYSACNDIYDEYRSLWLKLDINGQKLYLEYFKLLCDEYDEKELKDFIKKNETNFPNFFEWDEEEYRNKYGYGTFRYEDLLIVHHRNAYLLASLKNRYNSKNRDFHFDINEYYFKDAIDYYEKVGRVEYLAFVYMEYAKFLKTSEKENYKKKALHLFKNLGYDAYIEIANNI